jgi:hypothetical protein
VLCVTEKCKAKNNVVLNMQAVGLPLTRSMIRMNFNSTYFMEIFRGVDDNQTKVYESEWFTQDADHVFEPIEMTDGRLCNADPNE